MSHRENSFPAFTGVLSEIPPKVTPTVQKICEPDCRDGTNNERNFRGQLRQSPANHANSEPGITRLKSYSGQAANVTNKDWNAKPRLNTNSHELRGQKPFIGNQCPLVFIRGYRESCLDPYYPCNPR